MSALSLDALAFEHLRAIRTLVRTPSPWHWKLWGAYTRLADHQDARMNAVLHAFTHAYGPSVRLSPPSS